jgi:hypothetical protein
LFKKRGDEGEEKTIPISLAKKEKLEQKIGKALGLEKAAQLAVEELSTKGLLDEGNLKEKLQIMKEQANNPSNKSGRVSCRPSVRRPKFSNHSKDSV